MVSAENVLIDRHDPSFPGLLTMDHRMPILFTLLASPAFAEDKRQLGAAMSMVSVS